MSSLTSQAPHPALTAIAAIDAALDDLAETALWALTGHHVAEVTVAVEKLTRRLAAAQIRLAGELATRPPAALAGPPRCRRI